MNLLRLTISASVILCMLGCDGDSGRAGAPALIETLPLSIGSAECKAGGNQTNTGIDTNRNGTLDTGEIATSTYTCSNIDDLDNDYLVSTEGVYQGVQERAGIISFKGIPYAAPPINDLRFSPPVEAEAFDDVRSASVFGSACIQPNGLTADLTTGYLGEEDCLSLNVYRPAEDGIYPILVWIHGGGLSVGSSGDFGAAAPYRLVDQGLVIVSINYRLGLLGFLATEGLSIDQNGDMGNYGIKDQQAALEWINKNAAAFDGDSSNITVFGESAGGHSILTLLSSPFSEGLFHKAIVQSGAYLPNQMDTESSLAMGAGIVDALNCSGANELECLREQNLDDIFSTQSDFFGLIVLPTTGTTTLPQSIQTAFTTGSFVPLPLLIGTNRDEWTLFSALDELTAGDLPNGEVAYRSLLSSVFGEDPSGNFINNVVSTYPLNAYEEDVSLAYSALYGDFFFVCDSLNIAEKATRTVPVYMYEFADRQAPNWFGLPATFDFGASHAFELPYLLADSEESLTGLGFSPDQIALASSMVDYWTNFAKFGTPNSAGALTAWPLLAQTLSGDENMLRLGVDTMPFSALSYANEHACAQISDQISWSPGG